METAESHLQAAGTHLQQGHARDGLHEAQRALQTQPENGQAFALIGLAHTMMGDEIEAREALTKAQELAPRDSRVRYYSYIALGKLGDVPAARAQLTYFAQLEPGNTQAKTALAQLGGPVLDLPPLPRPQSTAVWYDGGGHSLMDSSDIASLREDAEPPEGPDVIPCPDCGKRTWKGWTCHLCGAPLPRPGAPP